MSEAGQAARQATVVSTNAALVEQLATLGVPAVSPADSRIDDVVPALYVHLPGAVDPGMDRESCGLGPNRIPQWEVALPLVAVGRVVPVVFVEPVSVTCRLEKAAARPYGAGHSLPSSAEEDPGLTESRYAPEVLEPFLPAHNARISSGGFEFAKEDLPIRTKQWAEGAPTFVQGLLRHFADVIRVVLRTRVEKCRDGTATVEDLTAHIYRRMRSPGDEQYLKMRPTDIRIEPWVVNAAGMWLGVAVRIGEGAVLVLPECPDKAALAKRLATELWGDVQAWLAQPATPDAGSGQAEAPTNGRPRAKTRSASLPEPQRIAFELARWAVEANPALGGKSAGVVYRWLKEEGLAKAKEIGHVEKSYAFPRSEDTFATYLRKATKFYGEKRPGQSPPTGRSWISPAEQAASTRRDEEG